MKEHNPGPDGLCGRGGGAASGGAASGFAASGGAASGPRVRSGQTTNEKVSYIKFI